MNKDDISLFEKCLNDYKTKNILIVVHKDPDFDAIGSALALALQLKSRDFKVKIWVTERLPDTYDFLPGLELIERKYPNSFNPEFIIALDSSNFDRIRDNHKLDITLPLLNIDHHCDNTNFGTYNIVWDISSVGEMLAHLFKGISWPLNKEIATCLYTAISFDTGQLSYSNTNALTVRTVADLLEFNIDHYKLCEWTTENKTPAYFEQVQHALKNMIYDEHYRYLYTTLPNNKESSGHDIINFIRQRKDVDVYILFRKTDSDLVKISLRAKSNFDLAKFAAQFDGGGHKKAAGIQLKGDIDHIQKTVIKALENELQSHH